MKPSRLTTLFVLFFVALLGAATARPSRPNFLLILADDMGFSDLGCYGGEISTPNIDRLAANGLRFTQFYNTGRCWPTRSSLLSGYYAQQVRMDPPQGRLPEWTRLLPHYLKPLGYRCYHSGKWHVKGAPRPVADGGFDRSYWFEDWDRYFTPSKHWEDDQKLPPVAPGSGYYATTSFADHTIKYLKEHAEKYPNQPFFSYLAFISPHFPLHALPEDIQRYRDRYLQGWDSVREARWKRLQEAGIVNSPLPPMETGFTPRYWKPELQEKLGPGELNHPLAWKDLSDEQKRFQATKMAIHAAMVDRMDREVGRVIEQLRAMGALENTVIFVLSDNGADASILVRGDGHDRAADPGSSSTFLCLGPGWASASNAPFRRHKIWVHEGGISTPLIVHWPAGIKASGQLRHDAGHLIDILPTLLELAGTTAAETPTSASVKAPSLPGKSLVGEFWRDGALKHDELFFHHEGNRALRMGDWKLVSAREDNDRWQLYNLASDRSELNDLSAQQPERVRQMQERWTQLDALYRRQGGYPPEDKVTTGSKENGAAKKRRKK